MKNLSLLKWTISLSLVFNIFGALAQSNQTDEIIKQLKNSRQFSCKSIGSNHLKAISDLEIFMADISYNLSMNEWDKISNPLSFIKTKNGIQPGGHKDQILFRPEFVASFKNNFKLKTEQDGIMFQKVLDFFNESYNSKGFFKEGNKWYFVRKIWFDDAEGFIVSTNAEGTITEIDHSRKIEAKVPETFLGEDMKAQKEDFFELPANQPDSLLILDYLNEKMKFNFEINAMENVGTTTITDAKFYEVKLIKTEVYEDEQYESVYTSLLMSYNGQFLKSFDSKPLIESKLFVESIKKDFLLNKETNAKAFEAFLDQLCPAEGEKSNNKNDDVWFFARELQGGEEKYGFMVLLNKNGSVKDLAYGQISDIGVLRLRMKDPNYNVDYAFKLTEPKTTTLSIKAGTDIWVGISFNQLAARAQGAWILTRFNGQNVGMYADTSIKSPFSDQIPGKEMVPGNHVVEYLLLSAGQSTENPLGSVKIEIEVK